MRLKLILSAVLVVLLGVVLHIATVRGLPGNMGDTTKLGSLIREASPFESSHERAPYAEMIAIKDNHTIQLTKDLANFGSPDIGFKGTKYFSFFPSGVSASILPGYLLGSRFNLGQVSAYLTMGLFTTIAMLFIFLICRDVFELPLWAAIIAPLTYAFGTTAWSYSVTIYQHAPAAALAMASFYSVWRYRQKGRKQFVWAAAVWFIYGISLFFDYPNALLLLPFMVYFLISSLSVSMVKRRKKVLRISMNSAILRAMPVFIALILYHGYHNAHFLGGWKQIGNNLQRYTVKTAEQIRQEKVDAKKRLERENATKRELAEKAGGGITKALSEDKVPVNAQILLVGVDKGLFLFSPIMLLALLGIITLRKKPIVEKSILLAFIIANVFVYSSFGDPYGGWAYGPRYLIPSMAGFSIFIAIGLTQPKLQILRKLTFVILFGVSSAIALAGALTTNLVPPKVEADFLKLKYYNFTHAFDLLHKNVSTSFVYNQYFASRISLMQYAEAIWMTLYVLVVAVVFIVPLMSRETPVKEANK
ncbi:hypothetical protein HYS00_02035 [Candidatus Microgenomates bacterium]|nr:hypothetical protein [Candidatus Microgenomates bacterium]